MTNFQILNSSFSRRHLYSTRCHICSLSLYKGSVGLPQGSLLNMTQHYKLFILTQCFLCVLSESSPNRVSDSSARCHVIPRSLRGNISSKRKNTYKLQGQFWINGFDWKCNRQRLCCSYLTLSLNLPHAQWRQIRTRGEITGSKHWYLDKI